MNAGLELGLLKLFGNSKLSIVGSQNYGCIEKNMKGEICAYNSNLNLQKNFHVYCIVKDSEIQAERNFHLRITGENHKLSINKTFGVTVEKDNPSSSSFGCKNSIDIKKQDCNTVIGSYFMNWLGKKQNEGGNRNFQAFVKYCDKAEINDNQFNLGIYQTRVEKLPTDGNTVCIEIQKDNLDKETFSVEKISDTKYCVNASEKNEVTQYLEVSGERVSYFPETGKFHITLDKGRSSNM